MHFIWNLMLQYLAYEPQFFKLIIILIFYHEFMIYSYLRSHAMLLRDAFLKMDDQLSEQTGQHGAF